MIELPDDDDEPYGLRHKALQARLQAATMLDDQAANELQAHASELEGQAAALEAGGKGYIMPRLN